MEAYSSYPQDLSCRKIYSFLEDGLICEADERKKIGEKYQFPITGSNDTKRIQQTRTINRICVNHIKQDTQIGRSLYNPSAGGFAVVVEEVEEEKGITQCFLEANKEKIEAKIREKQSEFPFPVSEKMVKPSAVSEVINADECFKEELSKKIARTALFIVQTPDEHKVSPTVEDHVSMNIPPENIKKVILPEKMKRLISQEKNYFEMHENKFEFVSDRWIETLEYGYTFLNDDQITIKIKNLIGPDYESALKGKEVTTHMTSLFPYDNEKPTTPSDS